MARNLHNFLNGVCTMEIELRQHQDGSLVISVRNGADLEIDITSIVHELFHDELFHDKLVDLQHRVARDEKYRR